MAGLAALGVSAWTAFSHPGSWEDDAYIFFRYAQNFAAGEGLAFNPGEPSFGITSVFWTLLLGVFSWTTRLEAAAAAKILSVVLFFGSVWILTRVVQCRTENPSMALWTGFLTALCPPLVFSAVSGMEIGLNLFLLSCLAASHFLSGRKKFLLGGVLIGFLFLTRPENILLLAIWGFLIFLETEERREKLFGLFLGFAAVALPWQIYFYSKTGLLFPPTRTGKLLLFLPAQYGVTLDQFQRLGLVERLEIAVRSIAVLFQVKNLLVFLPLLSLAGYYMLRGRIAVTRFWLAGAVYFLGLILLFAFFFPLIKLRYFIHIYPFLILASIPGGYHLWADLRARWKFFAHPFWDRAGVLLLLLSVPAAGFLTARKFAASSRQQEIRTEVGRWLKNNIPAEARVALEPIGAVGYHSERYIVDLGGLIQPEVWPYMKEGPNSRPDSLFSFLKWKGVGYLIDYNTHPWAGKVADAFPEKFELAAQIRSSYPPTGYNSYDIFKLRE